MDAKKSILICDDLWQVSRVIELYVKATYECECSVEQNPQKMLKRTAESKFDLILLDLQLIHSSYTFGREESGKDLIGMIRSSRQNLETPIVALTACTIIYKKPASARRFDYPNAEFWDDLKQIGFTDVIEKPSFHEQLEVVLKKYDFQRKDAAIVTIPESLFERINPALFVIDDSWGSSGITLRGNDLFHVRYFRKTEECIDEYAESYFLVVGVVINTKTEAKWKAALKTLLDISVVPNIIVVGDTGNYEDAVTATKLGATAYIGQPRNEPEFMDTISKLVESPLLESDIERREQWIGQRSMSGEELLKRFFSIMIKNNRLWRKKSLLTVYRDTYKGDRTNGISIDEVKECIETYLGKSVTDMPKGKLLLVEDDIESQQMTVLCFKNYFEIVTAGNGSETLDQLKKHDDIDIMLLDVFLPGKNADELYDEINGLKGEAQVIVLTAYPEMKGVNHFIKRKAYQYLQKPYNPEFLFKQMGLAWLGRIWRQTETKIDIHELPLLKRLIFLNELMCKKEQQGEAIYQNDVYALFPEFFNRIPEK